LDRKWHSPRGTGIYLSLILRPAVLPRDALQITLLSAVAVAETIMLLAGLEVQIKWPNDIMVNGKKIAGILSEMRTGMNSVDYVVVGTGINVTTREELFPEAVRNIATSVLMESGKEVSRSKIVCTFLEKIERGYMAFLRGESDGIRARWEELAGIMGKRIRIREGSAVVSGVVQYIDLYGFLYLRGDDGSVRKICSGDICS
jgi:BirA family biotin operon repressor/biotin-[acetyl-CoA-carboxylase] ligase